MARVDDVGAVSHSSGACVRDSEVTFLPAASFYPSRVDMRWGMSSEIHTGKPSAAVLQTKEI